MADAQHLLLGEACQVASIVRKGTHIRGYSRDDGLVSQVIVILVPGAELRVRLGVVCKISGIIRKRAHVGGHSRDSRNVVVCDITGIIVKGTHVGGYCWNCRLVEDFSRAGGRVPVGVHLRGHLCSRDVTRIVREGTHVRRHSRNLRCVRQVVVISAEAIGRLFRVQRVRHAQQLLHARDGVVVATIGVDVRLQEIRAVSPVYARETAVQHAAAADAHSDQPVGVGGRHVRLGIDGTARGAPLQDVHAHTHLRVGHQTVVGVAYHRLVAEPLGYLRKEDACAEHREDKGKDFFHNCVFYVYLFICLFVIFD